MASCTGRRRESTLLTQITTGTSYLAQQCIKVNPSWAKGYARGGAALHGMRRFDDAIDAYEAGLRLEDSPASNKGLNEVQDAKGLPLPFITGLQR
jgi:hypothetical protein